MLSPERLEIVGFENFMFHITAFKRSASAVPQHSKKHQGTTLDHPGLTTALHICKLNFRHSNEATPFPVF
jgi:hypothetical protein